MDNRVWVKDAVMTIRLPEEVCIIRDLDSFFHNL